MSAATLVDVALGTVAQARKILRILQWVVPVSLFALATVYEFVEHHIVGGEPLTFNLSMEVFLFGMVGPGALAMVIFYIRRLIEAQDQAQQQLENLNHQLEAKVLERTVALEQRNAELAQANLDLYRLDELKSDFVAMVSHELRAPLTILNGGLEMALQTSNAMPPRARSMLEIMAAESKRLTELVQTILDISRLEAGKLDINLGPVAVQPLIEQAAGVILAQSGRRIEWNIQPNLPPIWADEYLLDTVIRNLIRNADIYSPPDQPIHLSACLGDGSLIRIGVRDHGAGITPEMKERIFDRFVRGMDADKTPAGWGLGLYLARKLIDAQNGRIDVVSPTSLNRQSPGSEFAVLLPVASTPEDA